MVLHFCFSLKSCSEFISASLPPSHIQTPLRPPPPASPPPPISSCAQSGHHSPSPVCLPHGTTGPIWGGGFGRTKPGATSTITSYITETRRGRELPSSVCPAGSFYWAHGGKEPRKAPPPAACPHVTFQPPRPSLPLLYPVPISAIEQPPHPSPFTVVRGNPVCPPAARMSHHGPTHYPLGPIIAHRFQLSVSVTANSPHREGNVFSRRLLSGTRVRLMLLFPIANKQKTEGDRNQAFF